MSFFSPSDLVPLSDYEKENVHIFLQDKRRKIYAAASVSLVFSDQTKNASNTTLPGALVLFKAEVGLILQLLDVSTSPSTSKWQHSLTSAAALVETEQDGEKRTYALTDAELYIRCVFADDEEASKFVSKFLRAVDRIQKVTTPVGLEGNPSRIRFDEPDDRTIRGITTANGSCLAGSGHGHVNHRNNEVRMRQSVSGSSLEPSDNKNELGAAEIERATPVSANVAPDRSQDTKRQTDSQQGRESDTWDFTVDGITYRIPDLTNKLPQLPFSDAGTSGGFGTVRRTQLTDGTEVAVKTLFRRNDTPVGCMATNKTQLLVRMKERKRFKNEAAMQSVLKHRNVLPLLGIAESEGKGLSASLVLPWMKNSDSRTYLERNPQARRLPLVLGTIRGIAYLHSQGFVHGDIKARNILISDGGEPVLSDFGLTSFAEIEDRELSVTLAQAGTTSWMSPELFKSSNPGRLVTKQSDIWAFSMTIVELLTGESPFNGGNALVIIMNYEREQFPQRPESEECSDKLWELVEKCWALDPSQRPSAEAARCTIELIVGSSGSRSYP